MTARADASGGAPGWGCPRGGTGRAGWGGRGGGHPARGGTPPSRGRAPSGGEGARPATPRGAAARPRGRGPSGAAPAPTGWPLAHEPDHAGAPAPCRLSARGAAGEAALTAGQKQSRGSGEEEEVQHTVRDTRSPPWHTTQQRWPCTAATTRGPSSGQRRASNDRWGRGDRPHPPPRQAVVAHRFEWGARAAERWNTAGATRRAGRGRTHRPDRAVRPWSLLGGLGCARHRPTRFGRRAWRAQARAPRGDVARRGTSNGGLGHRVCVVNGTARPAKAAP